MVFSLVFPSFLIGKVTMFKLEEISPTSVISVARYSLCECASLLSCGLHHRHKVLRAEVEGR